MKRTNIDRITEMDKIEILKKCFYMHLGGKIDRNRNYEINGFVVSGSKIISLRDEYYLKYATLEEKNIIINKKFEREKAKNPKIIEIETIFDMFIKKEFEKSILIKKDRITNIVIEEDLIIEKRILDNFAEKFAKEEEKQLYIEKINDFVMYKEKEEVKKSKIISEQELRENFKTVIEKRFKKEELENYLEQKSIQYVALLKRIDKYIEVYATNKEKEEYEKLKEAVKIEKHEKRMKESLKKETKTHKTVELLIKNNGEELYKILKEENVAAHTIFEYLRIYNKKANLKSDILDSLEDKIFGYKSYLIDLKKEKITEKVEVRNNENVKFAFEILKDAIESKLSKSEILKKYDLQIEKYDKIITLVEENDKELLEKYKQISKEINIEKYNKLVTKVKMMMYYIENKIEEENYKRNFDIIDYYKMFKKDPATILKTVRRSITIDEEKMFSQFVSKYNGERILTESYINYLMNEKVELNCKKDDKGNLIKGSGIIIDETYKKEIFDFLRENNIKITDKTYQAAIRRTGLKLENKETVLIKTKEV